MIWQYLPPYGVGSVMQGIGASCWRIQRQGDFGD
jgi:hypothetical protein